MPARSRAFHLVLLAATLLAARPANAGIPISVSPGAVCDVRSVTYAQQGGYLSLVWVQGTTSNGADLRWSLFGAPSAANDVLPVEGGPLKVGPGDQSEPQIARTGTLDCTSPGFCPSAIVAYTEASSPNDIRVRAKRIGDGVSWDVILTPPATLAGHGQAFSDGGTGALVCWQLGESLIPRVQHLAGDGTILWAPLGVPLLTPDVSPENLHIVEDGSGGLFAVWEDTRNQPNRSIVAMRMGPDGAPAPGWPGNGLVIRTSPDFPQAQDVLADGAGGAFILWSEMTTLSAGIGNQPRMVR